MGLGLGLSLWSSTILATVGLLVTVFDLLLLTLWISRLKKYSCMCYL